MFARSVRIEDLDGLLSLLTQRRQDGGLGIQRACLEQALYVLIRQPRLGAIFVLDDGRKLVGGTVVTIGLSLELGGRAIVVNAHCVRSPYREQGLGQLLIDRVLAYARRAECSAIVLEPPLDDHRACRWYSDLGFEHRHGEYCSGSITALDRRLKAA